MDGPMPDPATLDADGDDDMVRSVYVLPYLCYSDSLNSL